MKKLNAVVIGGSNTVMRPGYLPELPRCFHPFGIELHIVANLPVGNTSIMMGLMQLKANVDALRAADVLFIEYTLNDTSFYTGPDGLAKWSRGYEGAIRFARTVNQKIKIVPIIFATQTGVHRTGINPLHAGVHYLAAHYGLAVADVNSAFIQRFGADFFEQPGMYQDFAHYQRPVVTNLAAEVVAERTAPYLLSDLVPGPLPPKLCATDYAECSLIRHPDVPIPTILNFKNYLYDVNAFEVAGNCITLEIEGGSIVAAQYICLEDAAQLYIQMNGAWFQCQTLQPGLVKPTYKFLLSMLNFDLPPAEGINRITLTTQRPEGVDLTKLVQVGTKPPVRPERSLPIAGLMHTGKLISVRVENMAQPELETA
ncbi:SGNH/GDSL hydrolase family protein [Paracoccus yeei]|uniref:SGNH/GDSL hydrolase family protein n=2 Tax=Paracoccus yeei TaxID=147645 RepID=A0A5P2QMP0_9RHOB|nr:SGNH/GDSL hydrolase family protein [Paracoccus yeei]QEU06953.1 SGNH/GDSL hydrolase family protein [Paracoccus yeei]